MEHHITFTIVLAAMILLTSQSQAGQALIESNHKEVPNELMCKLSCKYGNARIQYYANCTATHQLLLESGDIHPNPGPNSTNETDQHKSDHSFHGSDKICYDTEYLRSLNQNQSTCQFQRLPHELWKTISELGIAKRRKTRRGKRTDVQVTNIPPAVEDLAEE